MVEEFRLPLVGGRVEAGFPSPADDFIDRSLDLNDELVVNSIATFFVRASGHSMDGAGIHDGDLLVVDRSVIPSNGSVVVAVVDGGHTVKRFLKRGTIVTLQPEPSVINEGHYSPIRIESETDARVWGVVTYAIHRLERVCMH